MSELTTDVSWTAVVVGAIASFLLGWLWYSPLLFGRKWAEGLGLELGTANDMPAGAMIAQIIGLLLMSWFVAVTAVSEALLTVILATLAFTALAYSGGMFAKQNTYVRNVNAGYWIISLIIMIICNGIFRKLLA
ncbi:DUF1761 domain-containing protein [Lentilitoribacter sp. EG35]|jgi:hypothetical protein|uniref:DUF1761 domain-containing protein n=1 Tax=Lentilitoribacter sp. EG35 TaxID=3234192 RepID=UPI00345F1F50